MWSTLSVRLDSCVGGEGDAANTVVSHNDVLKVLVDVFVLPPPLQDEVEKRRVLEEPICN